MNVKKDYEELLRLLNKNKVKYCVVGAYAIAFYGRPRYTNDIDILVEPNSKNADKVIKTLNEFGFKSLKLSAGDFSKTGRIVQLGYEPLRIDIMTSIEGCGFAEIWNNRKRGKYGNEKIYFIGLKELIKNKKISNRKQDQADLEILKRIS
ncbi:MAG: nucleotidyltransferase [Candidatus Omnitrophota bacterium]|nr:nucleotidyltransferase [Candidatus Omnitrophota bacterium]